MPGVIRSGDSTSGEGCFPPETPASYSSTVFANGRGVVRAGDSRKTHCCPDNGCHSAVYTGSGNVYAEGRPIQKQGDSLSCGDTCSSCSGDVKIG